MRSNLIRHTIPILHSQHVTRPTKTLFFTSNVIPNCTQEQAKQTFLWRTGGLLWLDGGACPSALWVNSGSGTIAQLGAEMRRPSPQSACQTSLTHRFHKSPQHKQGIFDEKHFWNIVHGQVLLPAFLEVALVAEDTI